MRATSNARFDARLSNEQKEFLEYAASLGGFKSLSEFVLYAAQQKANQIIEQNQIVLKTRRDQEIFLKAIRGDSSPNEKLKSTYENFLKGKSLKDNGISTSVQPSQPEGL